MGLSQKKRLATSGFVSKSWRQNDPLCGQRELKETITWDWGKREGQSASRTVLAPLRSGSHMISPFSHNTGGILHKSPTPAYWLQRELGLSSICIRLTTTSAPEHICNAICRVYFFCLIYVRWSIWTEAYQTRNMSGSSGITRKVSKQLGCPGAVLAGKGSRASLGLFFMFIESGRT